MTKNDEINLLKEYLKGSKKAAKAYAEQASRLALKIANYNSTVGTKTYHKIISKSFASYFLAIDKYIENKRYKKSYKPSMYFESFVRKTLQKK